jgi:hypothetical protein
VKTKLYIIALIFIFQSFNAFAWNAVGHRLIAQIAYDKMTPHARGVFNQYNQSMDKIYKPLTFVNAAVWLDTLRYQDVNWFATMHYVDFPFSVDGSPLPSTQEINALWAIAKATNLLSNKYAKDFDKGTALRVLLHVVGDIHQPLHATTRVSTQFPQGDRGGNLLVINGTRVAKNLHSYWDKGAGLLVVKRRYSQAQIEKRALDIERRWPCNIATVDSSPLQWAEESHTLAVNKVYKTLPANNLPDINYQRSAQKVTEQRIALAGCRLGALLNKIDEKK